MMEQLKNYIRIARPDHWFKNIFMLPGILFAFLFTRSLPQNYLFLAGVGVFSTCLIASANYVINEWLDRDFDKHHPKKCYRPSVVANLKGSYVYLEYVALASLGLALGALVSWNFLAFSLFLLLMGLVYNIPPVRTKERLYFDVISESVNNPIRFLLGWSIIEWNYLPPSSILLAFWTGGAFLMGIKRFAEFRAIGSPERAGLYRQSFKYYTEHSLLISSFFYALSSTFFLGIFLIKYRIEYLLCFPFFSGLFAWYLKIGLAADSTAQSPEKLYREKVFLGYIVLLCILFVELSFVDIPWLRVFLSKTMVQPW